MIRRSSGEVASRVFSSSLTKKKEKGISVPQGIIGLLPFMAFGRHYSRKNDTFTFRAI